MNEPSAASPYRGPGAALHARDPSIPFARSLEEASLCEVVNINTLTGALRPPGTRTGCALAVFPAIGIGLIIGICGVANIVSGFDIGQTIGGALIGTVFLSLGLWIAASVRGVIRAGTLVNTGKLDEAEALLGKWKGMRSMGVGDLYGGSVASLRGDHARALEKYGKVAAFFGSVGQMGIRGATNLIGATHEGAFGRRPSNPQVLVGYLEAAYHAARALSNLGRAGEARQLIDAAGPPLGEYLTLLRTLGLLYVDFCSGVSTIPNEELHALADRGARLEGTWGLLGLCGWAYEQRGDRATSERLVRDELGRPGSGRLEALMPPLYRWMRTV